MGRVEGIQAQGSHGLRELLGPQEKLEMLVCVLSVPPLG